jgi:hypothetical protein
MHGGDLSVYGPPDRTLALFWRFFSFLTGAIALYTNVEYNLEVLTTGRFVSGKSLP